jgi:cell division protein FtsZ
MQRRNPTQQLARIRVVGIGAGGLTAVNGLLDAGLYGVDFLTIDTDSTSMRNSKAPLHIRLGKENVDDSGAAGDPELGRKAALAAIRPIGSALRGSDLIFILAGFGGGSGTGAAPVVARIARRLGALVIGLVTFPFPFEGEKRAYTARRGIAWIRNWADTLVVIPNSQLLEQSGGQIGFHETYNLAHTIWKQSVRGITDLVNHSGLINVDFADVRAIMSEGGGAIIATGRAKGADRARRAAQKATQSDLLGITIDGAQGLLFNISGGPDLSLQEVEEAAEIITSRVNSKANVIFGAAVNHSITEEIRITVIATGFTFSSQMNDSWVLPDRQLRPHLGNLSLRNRSRIDRPYQQSKRSIR